MNPAVRSARQFADERAMITGGFPQRMVGAHLAGNPLFLAGALKKLTAGVARSPMNDANPSTAPLFIVNPFTAKGVLSLFSTHPPIEERIKRLEDMAYRR